MRKKKPQYKTLKEFIKGEMFESEKHMADETISVNSMRYYVGGYVALQQVMKFLEGQK